MPCLPVLLHPHHFPPSPVFHRLVLGEEQGMCRRGGDEEPCFSHIHRDMEGSGTDLQWVTFTWWKWKVRRKHEGVDLCHLNLPLPKESPPDAWHQCLEDFPVKLLLSKIQPLWEQNLPEIIFVLHFFERTKRGTMGSHPVCSQVQSRAALLTKLRGKCHSHLRLFVPEPQLSILKMLCRIPKFVTHRS